MKYKDKSFTVPVGGDNYASNWERTFRAEAEQLDPRPTPGEPSLTKQTLLDFACRECASTVRVITSKPIAAKGSFFIRVDIGSTNSPLACPVCRNTFTAEEKL